MDVSVEQYIGMCAIGYVSESRIQNYMIDGQVITADTNNDDLSRIADYVCVEKSLNQFTLEQILPELIVLRDRCLLPLEQQHDFLELAESVASGSCHPHRIKNLVRAWAWVRGLAGEQNTLAIEAALCGRRNRA